MKVDMSSDAITARLKAAGELTDLCIMLGGERLRKKRLEMLPEKIRKEIFQTVSGKNAVNISILRW